MSSEIEQLALIKKDLTEAERVQFDTQYNGQKKSPTLAFVLSLFGGIMGLDRFYLGHSLIGGIKISLFVLLLFLASGGSSYFNEPFLGIAQRTTYQILFLFVVADWFLIMWATKKKNILTTQQIHDSIIKMR